MAKIFVPIFAVLFIAMGIYSALGAWLPRLRANWKGTNQPVPPLSCAGFGLFFICLGLIMLAGDSISKPVTLALLILGISGWILIAGGAALDARARSRSSFRLPNERRVTSPEEQRGWLFAAFGILFVGTILWMIFTYK